MPRPKPSYVDELETLLRTGDIATAVAELKSLPVSTVERADAARVAGLARRVGIPELGLRLLTPLVRPTSGREANPSTWERAEYAEALNKLGAREEALQLLEELDTDEVPQVDFFKASVMMGQWNYREAITLLEKYLEKEADSYLRLVAKVNLAAGLVYERNPRAENLLSELRRATAEGGSRRLLGNTLELSATHYGLAGAWHEAEAFLLQAEGELAKAGPWDLFFVEKWRALLQLFRDGAQRSSLEALDTLKKRAIERGHWETWRDCDRYRALATQDPVLAEYVYQGTPYPAFRARLLEDFRLPLVVHSIYDWNAPSWRDERPVRLDLNECRFEGEALHLDAGSLPHRLLRVLCGDFYRSIPVGTIHARLFPEEYFDVRSSPARIHQLLYRLRESLEKGKVPLEIRVDGNGFRLRFPAAILVRLGEPVKDKQELTLLALREKWPTVEFSIREAGEALAIHPRVLQRVLKKANEEGTILKSGQGTATRYRFAGAGPESRLQPRPRKKTRSR